MPLYPFPSTSYILLIPPHWAEVKRRCHPLKWKSKKRILMRDKRLPAVLFTKQRRSKKMSSEEWQNVGNHKRQGNFNNNPSFLYIPPRLSLLKHEQDEKPQQQSGMKGKLYNKVETKYMIYVWASIIGGGGKCCNKSCFMKIVSIV